MNSVTRCGPLATNAARATAKMDDRSDNISIHYARSAKLGVEVSSREFLAPTAESVYGKLGNRCLLINNLPVPEHESRYLK